MQRIVAVLIGVGAALAGCGGAAPLPSAQLPSDPDVVALLPSGATSLVVAAPRRLFREPAARLLITRLVPDARLELLRMQHGIDARELDQLIVASYESGDIFVLRGPFLAHVAVAEMAHRMIPLESHAEAPRARAAGIFRGTRVDAIAIGPHTLAVVAGPPALSGRLLASLEGESLPFDATEVRSLPDDPPFVWLRPVPFELPPDAPVGILLARVRSTCVTAVPSGTGSIGVSVRFTGEFPPGADGNFRRLASSLAQTDLGRAVGMADAMSSFTLEAVGPQVRLAALLSAEGLARGLWLAMGAEIEDALSDPPPGPR